MSFSITYNDLYVVNKPFLNPSLEVFNEWREDFLAANDLSGLNVMFMGNAAEQFFGNSTLKTADIDIIMSGDIPENDLKTIKESALLLGIEKRLLVDTLHISQDIFTNRWWDNGYTVTKLVQKSVINTGTRSITRVPNYAFTVLDSGLHQVYKASKEDSSSYRKFKKRLDAGHYQDLRYNLKTMEQLTFS